MAFALIYWLKSCTTSVVDINSIPTSSIRSLEEDAIALVPLGLEYYQAKILKLDDDYAFLEALEVTATGRILQQPGYSSKNIDSDWEDEENKNKNKNKRKTDEIRCHTEGKKKQKKDSMRRLDKELLSDDMDDNDDSDLNVQISISPEKSSVIRNEGNSPEKSRETEEIHRQNRTKIKKNNDAMQKRGDECRSRNEDHMEDYNPDSQVLVSQGSLSNISNDGKCLIASPKKIDNGNNLELKPFNRKANKKIFTVETEDGSRKVEELQRNSSVYVNYDKLKLIKTECATNPNEMIRRLLKIIVGVDELKNMTALGKKTSYAKEGRIERKAIPMHILNAVKDSYQSLHLHTNCISTLDRNRGTLLAEVLAIMCTRVIFPRSSGF